MRRYRRVPIVPRKLFEEPTKPVVSSSYLIPRYTSTFPTRLPNDIQNAVCNKEIKIDRNLYNLFWGDGQW